jgi:hypothetical protein
MTEPSTTTAAPAIAVVLLQPTRLGGKNHPEGTTLTLPHHQAQSLYASGSAQPASTEATQEATPEAKPAGKRGQGKAKAAE